MTYKASDLIAIAKGEIGYLEKKSNSQLDSKTANAGSGNWTKYAAFFDTKYPDFYNGKKNGYAWCDMFVDWCFFKAFGEAGAKKLTNQPDNNIGAGCPGSANYYKKVDRFYTKSPKVGDQIFFKNSSGNACHTGLVYAVDKTYVYTIEGNTSSASGVIANGGAVAQKKYKLSYSRIYGYGRPNYDKETTSTVKPVETAKPATTVKPVNGNDKETYKMPEIKKGSTGKAVKIWQVILGFTSVNVDGDFGPNTLAKTKAWQKKNGLTVDGIVGDNTWKAGLNSLK